MSDSDWTTKPFLDVLASRELFTKLFIRHLFSLRFFKKQKNKSNLKTFRASHCTILRHQVMHPINMPFEVHSPLHSMVFPRLPDPKRDSHWQLPTSKCPEAPNHRKSIVIPALKVAVRMPWYLGIKSADQYLDLETRYQSQYEKKHLKQKNFSQKHIGGQKEKGKGLPDGKGRT